MNSLLKFDPKNTELLSQKQKLLSSAIEDTEERLKTLRTAAQKAKEMLESGELGQDKYDALQREIIDTENKLKKLQSQSKDTSKALESSSSGLDKLASSADNASKKLEGASKKAGALLGALAATVPATQEIRRDLSFLEQNANEAGETIEGATEAFKIFNAVSGETDSSIEGISNLLQADFTGNNLQEAVELLSGAVTRFPDTLKVESLSDSLQETLATSKATGQFGELLDRLGIGADNFSEGLQKCKTQADKQNYALKTLSRAGLKETYNGWRDNNKELVEYQDATFELEEAVAELSKTIAPIVTKVAEIGTKGIKAFNSLSEPVQNTILGLLAATAAASPMLKIISNITTATKNLTGSSKLLSGALSKIPYVAVAGVAVGLVAAIGQVISEMNDETRAAEKLRAEHEKNVESIKAQTDESEFYLEKLEELSEKENKSTQEKQLMQEYVDKLNESTENLNLTYDKEKDKLNQTTEAIRDKLEAREQELLQEKYLEQADEALESYVDNQIKLSEVETERAEVKRKLNELDEKGTILTEADRIRKRDLENQLRKLDTEYNDLSRAMNVNIEDYTAMSNAAALQSDTWDELLQEAGMLKSELPPTLVEALNAGKYTIPKTVEELNSLISFDEAVQKAGNDGLSIVNDLSAQMRNGDITVEQAAQKLNDAMIDKLGEAEWEAREIGEDIAGGVAAGINSASWNVINSAVSMVNSAFSQVKNKIRSNSPSKLWRDKIGKSMGEGIAVGLEESTRMVENASTALTDAALSSASTDMKNQSNKSNILASNPAVNPVLNNQITVMIGNKEFQGYIVDTASKGLSINQRNYMRAGGRNV